MRSMRSIVSSIAVLLCCLISAAISAEKPNVVFIISDDHAWTDHGFMGHDFVQTPRLDQLAAESLVFSRGYVPTSLCRPSLATMITGLFPHQHGITGNDPPGGRDTMSNPTSRQAMVDIFRRNKNLASMLGEAGYVSHQSGKWWEGNPVDSGFTAGMTHGDVNRGGRHGDEGLKIGREGMQPVLDFIDSAHEKPFFVWYAPFLPHTPHNPPERLLSKYRSAGRPLALAKYYAMIEWLDETVGQLLDHLQQRGLDDNTMVVYVVDNGWIQAIPPAAMPDSRSKVSPYDAGIRTPIMVRWPGTVSAGRDDDSLACSIDLVPTVLRAAGIAVPDNLPGINLLHKTAIDEREFVYGELFAHTAVAANRPVANLKYRTIVRNDGWKLILPFLPNRDVQLMIGGQQTDWMRLQPELYNVISDPSERMNKATNNQAIVETLRSRLNQWWSDPQSYSGPTAEQLAGQMRAAKAGVSPAKN